MKILETILVSLIVIGALAYLYRTFKPKKNGKGGCGCGTTDCKVPKTKIQRTKESSEPKEK